MILKFKELDFSLVTTSKGIMADFYFVYFDFIIIGH